MNKDKSTKLAVRLAVLNLPIMTVNILLFSRAFFNLDLSGANIFSTALGYTVIIMSFALFLYGNISILKGKAEKTQQIIKDSEINTLDMCKVAAQQYIDNNVKTYADNLRTVISQADRLQKKKKSTMDILSERFSDTEMSYVKFVGAIEQMERIMILNIRSLHNRINAFDEEEYEKMLWGKETSGYGRSDKLTESRLSIYNEYKAFVEKAVENNEEIIFKLDRLLLEISKLNDSSDGNIEEMDAMKEIETLIRDTKWYK